MIEDALDYLEGVRERPAWQPIPAAVRNRLDGPLPRDGSGEEAAYREFLELVLPYPAGNIHPRFWGWVNGTGSPFGALAELLKATMNVNSSGFDQASTLVESQVLDWCKELLGFPREASGLLVTGGSMANLIGLTVARNSVPGRDVRERGLVGLGDHFTVYASSEVHSSLVKAVELLGLGRRNLRLVGIDDERRIDIAALDAAIRDDRERGAAPLAIVGTAGTVGTGAIDDLHALADLAADHRVWLHVDGAFGAIAAISPRLRPLLHGLERADSLAFDLHKWMYMPYDVGCVLVRDAAAHRAAFEWTPSYLRPSPGGVASTPAIFADHGVELSREFRALKVWLSLKAEGADKYARLVEQNVDQARHLAALVAAHPDLELLAPAPLNVVCFRYAPPGATAGGLDELNERILVELQERGIAVPSSTVVDGAFAIRVAITNHRTRRPDIDLLVTAVLDLGAELVDSTGSAAR